MVRYEEILDSDIDWVIEETCSNLTSGQYIGNCIRRSLEAGNYYGIKAMDGDDPQGAGQDDAPRRGVFPGRALGLSRWAAALRHDDQ